MNKAEEVLKKLAPDFDVVICRSCRNKFVTKIPDFYPVCNRLECVHKLVTENY